MPSGSMAFPIRIVCAFILGLGKITMTASLRAIALQQIGDSTNCPKRLSSYPLSDQISFTRVRCNILRPRKFSLTTMLQHIQPLITCHHNLHPSQPRQQILTSIVCLKHALRDSLRFEHLSSNYYSTRFIFNMNQPCGLELLKHQRTANR